MALSDQKQAWQNLDGIDDAQGQNASARGVRVYTDLDLFFGYNNRTKDVNTLKDIDVEQDEIKATSDYDPKLEEAVNSVFADDEEEDDYNTYGDD